MGSRLFVGNLSYATTEEGLRRLFDDGQRQIVEVRIITDRDTGRSRGFGFVELGDSETARAAIEALDGVELDGRPLQVREARDRGTPAAGRAERRPPRIERSRQRPSQERSSDNRSWEGSDERRREGRPPRPFQAPPPDLLALEGRGGGRAERERRRHKRKKKRDHDPEEDDW